MKLSPETYSSSVHTNCLFQLTNSVKNIINTFYKRQSLLYNVLLYLASVAVIVYLFPKGGKFKYDIQKGKPWQYETLIAPFDFPIYKSLDEITAENSKIFG